MAYGCVGELTKHRSQQMGNGIVHDFSPSARKTQRICLSRWTHVWDNLRAALRNEHATTLRPLAIISWHGADGCQLPRYAASSLFLVSRSSVFLGARAFTASIILRVSGFECRRREVGLSAAFPVHRPAPMHPCWLHQMPRRTRVLQALNPQESGLFNTYGGVVNSSEGVSTGRGLPCLIVFLGPFLQSFGSFLG